MSSTTDPTPTRARGQVLVIFALSLVTLILFAALAFDTGQMLLERRDQQDAADAAALAGAYYLPDDPTLADARAADVATANGFTDGVDSVSVTIDTSPSGYVAGSAIEVRIKNNRPSIFGGIMGVAGWDVSSRAVAVNENGVPADFAMLALDPSMCDALLVTGNGNLNANGNIQVNSDCPTSALKRKGPGTITVSADSSCNVVGGISSDGGKGYLDCTTNQANPIPDPLASVDPPAKPGYPQDVYAEDDLADNGQTLGVPDGCPGAASGVVSTDADPITCQFTSSYAGTAWRLYPGDYPGGIQLQGGTFYWEPGIYWIGGGGVTITGNGTSSTSVAAGGTSLDFGILIYNTEDPSFHDACAAGTAPAQACIQDISLNGQSAQISFWPLKDGSIYDGILIWSDRDLSADVIINGSDSGTTDTRGTIYDATGEVQVNGHGGTLNMDQVIANNFVINGSGGTINVNYDTSFIYTFSAAGLVE